jgi:hypothetical protein
MPAASVMSKEDGDNDQDDETLLLLSKPRRRRESTWDVYVQFYTDEEKNKTCKHYRVIYFIWTDISTLERRLQKYKSPLELKFLQRPPILLGSRHPDTLVNDQKKIQSLDGLLVTSCVERIQSSK